MDHIILGILFLVWGVADVLRSSCPAYWASGWNPPAPRSAASGRGFWVYWSSSWARAAAVHFFSDNQTVTSIILAVMILAAVCILGPYYHWRKQEKENTQE